MQFLKGLLAKNNTKVLFKFLFKLIHKTSFLFKHTNYNYIKKKQIFMMENCF